MQFGLEYIMRNHGIEHRTADFNTVVAQYQHIVFYILSDLQCFFVFKNCFKFINNFQSFFTVCRNRNIKCLIFGKTEAHSYQFGGYWIGSRSFRI